MNDSSELSRLLLTVTAQEWTDIMLLLQGQKWIVARLVVVIISPIFTVF